MWEETENEIRSRIQSPDLFDPDTFRRKEITDGVSLVLAKKKGQTTMETQAIRFDKSKFTMAQAKEWYEKHKGSFKFKEKDLKTFDLKDVIIFSTGIHNGDKYEEEDLKNMEKAFNELKSSFIPPLKLGHDDNQELSQEDGMPAVGWIENLKYQAGKLIADICRIPEKVHKLLKAGAYRRLSPEIYWNYLVGDKKYPYTLKAVSLLGADLPACKSVSDILSLYTENKFIFDDKTETEIKTYEFDSKKVKEMEEKEMEELKAKIAELEKQIKEYQEKQTKTDAEKKQSDEKVAQLKSDLDKVNAELTQSQIEKEKIAYTENIDKLIASKKLLPKQKEGLLKLLLSIPKEKKYKEGEKEVCFSDAVLNLLQENGELNIQTTEDSEAGAKQDEYNAILQLSKEKKITYREAYIEFHKTK